MQSQAKYLLDITKDVCPMTFVKAKLSIERLKPGETLAIRLQGKEPLTNVPKSILELGHDIVSITPEHLNDQYGVHLLIVAKTN